MDSEYYRPVEVFRQPALYVKKRQAYQADRDRSRRPWIVDVSRINSPMLRKASGDLNDYVTTSKLKTEVWNLPIEDRVSSLAVDDGLVVFSTVGQSNRLHLYDLGQDSPGSYRHKLHGLQKVTIPGAPILETELIRKQFNETITSYDTGLHDIAILTGHSDGMVNIVTTSELEGNAKLLRRFDHSRYLKITKEGNDSSLDAELSILLRTKPIRYLKLWGQGCFLSQINESIFIFDINHQTKVPIYLQSFSGLESIDINPKNQHVLSLTGTRFGSEGVAILDLRSSEGDNGLHVPKSSRKETSKSIASKWLDEYTLCSSIGRSLKLWDIRYGGTKAEFHGHQGYIESLLWDEPSKNLYTVDDQGLTISWDLNALKDTKEVLHCLPSHGIHSFAPPTNNLLCGSIVQSPDLVRLQRETKIGTRYCGLWNSKLVTLEANELRCIHRFESPVYITPPRNPLRQQNSEARHSVVSSCSSSEDVHDEIFSTVEDSDGTLDSDICTPIIPRFLDSDGDKSTCKDNVPVLSGIRRYSDSIFGLT